MKTFKLLKRRSILSKLPKTNAVRCNCTSLVIIVMVLILMILDKTAARTGHFFENYGSYLFAMCIISAVEILALRIISIKKGRKDNMYMLSSNIYIILMSLILFVMADKFLELTGSLTFYFIALLFVALVPVLGSVQYKVALISQLVVMTVYIVEYIDSPILIIQVVAINLIMPVISMWKYYTILGRIELSSRLSEEVCIAEQDPLTKLSNRRGMERKISVMFPLCERHKIPVGVIMLDIDQFKKYNDTFGHPQGDVCIKSISRTLKATAGNGNDIIARVGGEEFVIFIQDIEKVDLILLTKRIQNSIQSLAIKHSPSADFECVTVSAGLAYGNPCEGCTFEKLYREADKALYLAKENGRNCIGIDGKVMAKNQNLTENTIEQYDSYYMKQAVAK